jgi:lysophospholipase L1-like esterase
VIQRWRQLPLGLRATVLLLSTLALLLGVELWAQQQAPRLPTWTTPDGSSTLMNGHPSRLWGMAEGTRDNAGATATINRLGLRGPVPEVPRPPGRQRLLLLGDSAFFGHGVADHETLSAQLQARLQTRGIDADVVNAAVAGYSIAQSRLLMEEVGWALQPTMVLYASLWSDNTFDAFPDEDLLRSRRLAQHNPLVRSAAFRLLAARLSRSKLVVWRPEEGWPTGRVRRVPLDRFIALTDELIRDGARRSVGAAFILPTNRTLLTLDPREADSPRSPSRFWQPYFAAQEALAACHGVPSVALTPAFHDAGHTEDDLFLDLMHPTPLGQALTAEAIDAALQASGWPGRLLIGDGTPCDLGHIEDVPAPEWSSDQRSPQQRLFVSEPR